MTHTLIIEIDGRKYPYRVIYTSDGEKYLDELNVKRARVLYAFKGNYEADIRRIGINKFVKMMRSDTPIIALGLNLVS